MKRRRLAAPAPVAPAVRQGHYRLHDDVAWRVHCGHPWVYRDALGGRALVEDTGALVDLTRGNHDFVARGFVDQDHPVAVRVLTRDPGEQVEPGRGVIAARLARAVELRARLFGSEAPDAMRLLAGDSEGLPGVNVDRYARFVVVQWLSAGALPWRDELLDAVERHAAPLGVYEQRRLRARAAAGQPAAAPPPPEPARRCRGEEAPLEIPVTEAGCTFAVDVTAPLGVGFFHDLRLGRAAVAARAPGQRVLNLFSYTGAFSVRAAKAGAREVVAVDTANKAHGRSRRNADLSGLGADAIEYVTADARKALDRFAARGRIFDLVVCDPPTFAHGSGPGAAFSVGAQLAELVQGAAAVLDPGGLLALATNSARLSAADVDRALGEGAAGARADLRVVERHGLPPDFPVAPGFPEGNFLKFVLAVRA